MNLHDRTRPARRPRVTVALVLALCTLIAACGQLPDVRLEGAARPADDGRSPAATDEEWADDEWADEEWADDDWDADLDGDDVERATADAGDTGATGNGDTGNGERPTQARGSGEQRPASGNGGEPSGTAQQTGEAEPADEGAASNGRRQVRGSDRTGVTDDTIVLGAHAPVTGAAPLPSRAFEESSDLYWRYIIEHQNQTVLGRTNIELHFADDRYQPSTATQVCRQLAQRVFGLSGAGGTDQIQACARFANNAQVPYSSVGVTERGLENLPWYFAFSMTYRAQGELLAQYVRANFQGKKVAAVVTDTPNFDDAVEGWERGVQAEGLDYFRTFRHPRGDTSWYNTIARELSNAGVEVLYINTSPVDYIRFAQQADQQGFRPQYVGVGITMGLNAVLGSGCPQVADGIFFSPFPGMDWARENVPEFFEAAEIFDVVVEDLSFAIWGQSQATHEMLTAYGEAYGNDLTREDYRDFVETQQGVSGKIFPRLNYSPDNHFGADQVHVLQADCDTEEHRTLHTFASSF